MGSRVCASASGEQNGQGESGHSTSRAWSRGRGPARSLRPAAAAPPEAAGQGEGAEPMSSLTAWRFSGTEEADDAVLRLKRLNEQDLILLKMLMPRNYTSGWYLFGTKHKVF